VRGLRATLRSMDRPPDGVLLMAGTNDLASDATADEVLAAIRELHRVCVHEFGLKTIALSVPPNRAAAERVDGGGVSAFVKSYVARWRAVNAGLANTKDTKGGAGGSACEQAVPRFFDVGERIAYFPESRYWEQDGLHMSAAGYARLGTSLAPLVRATFFAKAAVVSSGVHHQLHIQQKYLDWIVSGDKTWEGRILSDRVRAVVVGDTLQLFTGAAGTHPTAFRVAELRHFDTFRSMLTGVGLRSCLPGCASLDAGVALYRGFPRYAELEAAGSGVVAFRLVRIIL
jgi:ASC-1-like (ASCH) protein